MADQPGKHWLLKKLSIGTVQFGVDYGISNTSGKTGLTEVNEILKAANSYGIDLLDTAWGYGDSEDVLGNVVNSDLPFNIVSKFPDLSGDRTVSFYLSESLRRLKVKRLYGYLAHSTDVILKRPECWTELQVLKDQGLIGKIGYSLYSPEQLDDLLSHGFKPDLIQIPYNIMDRRFESSFEKLKEMNVEIHCRSTFLQGLFFMEPDGLTGFFEPIKPRLKKLKKMYPSSDLLSGALLSFSLGNRHIDRVVIGVNTTAQLGLNVRSIISNEFPESLDEFRYFHDDVLLPYKWPKQQ